AEFNLEPFRDLGRDDLQNHIMTRIRAVTGIEPTRLSVAMPCELLLRDWLRTRQELIEPYFQARAELATEPEPVAVPASVPGRLETGPPSAPPASDSFLHPDRPFSNELAIRRVLRELRGNVLWYEQHLDRKALELLLDDLVLDAVDEIRLLSGP